jgi:hypothetical protein
MTQPELPRHGDDFVPTEELLRLHGPGPVLSLDELAAADVFGSDEEYEEFLAWLYESRRSGMS